MEVKRIVSRYEKKGDSFIDQIELDIDLVTLKQIWEPFENDPLFYMSYPVKEEQAKTLNKMFGVEVELDKYDCFLECYALE